MIVGIGMPRKSCSSETLPDVRSKLLYLYDFGDNWEHTIQLEKILDPVPGEQYPVCVDGARACPPEDCGGGGYAQLLEVLADPDDEEYEEMRERMGEDWDPEEFDCHYVNSRLRRRDV